MGTTWQTTGIYFMLRRVRGFSGGAVPLIHKMHLAIRIHVIMLLEAFCSI
jgi:hypothetical protein